MRSEYADFLFYSSMNKTALIVELGGENINFRMKVL